MSDDEFSGATAAAAPEFAKTLDEFCVGLSSVDKRVELIAGFHASEKAAGHFKDMASEFATRFATFANAPA